MTYVAALIGLVADAKKESDGEFLEEEGEEEEEEEEEYEEEQ